MRPALGKADVGAGLLTLALVYALKRFYSAADADALTWILAPSCWVASHAGGLTLLPEPGAGFISHEARMVVGSACAGVNFLVVAWLALYFSGQARFARTRAKLGWLCAVAALAYGATIAANGARIVLAAQLFDADLYGGHGLGALITKSRLHRALGVFLYCGLLLPLCAGGRRLSAFLDTETFGAGAPVTAWARTLSLGAPLAFYLGVVLVVPLLRRGVPEDAARFVEHALCVITFAGLVTLLLALASMAAERLEAFGRRVLDRICFGGRRRKPAGFRHAQADRSHRG